MREVEYSVSLCRVVGEDCPHGLFEVMETLGEGGPKVGTRGTIGFFLQAYQKGDFSNNSAFVSDYDTGEIYPA